MSPEQFNAIVTDLPDNGLLPRGDDGGPAFKRSEYAVSEVLCSAKEGHPLGVFAVGKTSSGNYVAVWHCHADLFREEAELLKALNKAEAELLNYKAHV